MRLAVFLGGGFLAATVGREWLVFGGVAVASPYQLEEGKTQKESGKEGSSVEITGQGRTINRKQNWGNRADRVNIKFETNNVAVNSPMWPGWSEPFSRPDLAGHGSPAWAAPDRNAEKIDLHEIEYFDSLFHDPGSWLLSSQQISNPVVKQLPARMFSPRLQSFEQVPERRGRKEPPQSAAQNLAPKTRRRIDITETVRLKPLKMLWRSSELNGDEGFESTSHFSTSMPVKQQKRQSEFSPCKSCVIWPLENRQPRVYQSQSDCSNNADELLYNKGHIDLQKFLPRDIGINNIQKIVMPRLDCQSPQMKAVAQDESNSQTKIVTSEKCDERKHTKSAIKDHRPKSKQSTNKQNNSKSVDLLNMPLLSFKSALEYLQYPIEKKGANANPKPPPSAQEQQQQNEQKTPRTRNPPFIAQYGVNFNFINQFMRRSGLPENSRRAFIEGFQSRPINSQAPEIRFPKTTAHHLNHLIDDPLIAQDIARNKFLTTQQLKNFFYKCTAALNSPRTDPDRISGSLILAQLINDAKLAKMTRNVNSPNPTY